MRFMVVVNADKDSEAGALPDEFEHAAALTRNTRERELLLDRARLCLNGSSP